MSSFEIVDNFLDKDKWEAIYEMCCGSNGLPYFINNGVATNDDPNPYHFYFTHTFYNNYDIQSSCVKVLQPLINKINPLSIIRIKGNLYPRTKNVDVHEPHIDYDFNHKGAVYMVNDNNGFTTMSDGYKVKSVANRIVFFNPSLTHSSSSCSNQKYRSTINFNFF